MKLVLAGFNLDVETLKEFNNGKLDHGRMTPETISAAYARISRSPKPVDELRELSRKEVEKCRRSNKNIIFKMGHHSVAEHAVFNFDVIGVSRFAIEELEKFRLCSYTEKSQRYITLEGEFIVPDEIKNTPLQSEFVATVKELNHLYGSLFGKLKEHVFKKYPDLAADPKNNSLLEGWAKEDARYITPLAGLGQLGQTINARNLELLLRRFASNPLKEVRDLGRKYHDLAEKIAPSIILFYNANDFDQRTYPELKEYIKAQAAVKDKGVKPASPVRIISHTADTDNITLASLLHAGSGAGFDECLKKISAMDESGKKELIKRSFEHMEFYDSTLREFEHVTFTYELTVSAACFGQLKRHRMASLTAQPYDPSLGVVVPGSIKEIGMEKDFIEGIKKSEELYEKISGQVPEAAPYILTNAHQRRVLFTANAREIYHIARLREDGHAQWDIRNISALMTGEAGKIAPLTMALACGKDVYPELYADFMGKSPKIVQTAVEG
ncbi:FAD-dependent thymidylate synthase [Candidatus Auribacterota bacterium]